MKIAYIDSSCLVAIALDEPGAQALLIRISRFDRLFSSNLLEAEMRSALSREGRRSRFGNFLAVMRWVFPHRRLTQEVDQILVEGTLRGPDLWHLACALFLRARVGNLSFVTLDNRQGDIARSLGFRSL
ncbi:MAG TPA: type II toxin-antitoxin system VapC family toxin [Thermoanaerobaculia bacterium]